MPLSQFDERVPQTQQDVYDDVYTPNTFPDYFQSAGGAIRWDTVQLINSDTIDHNVIFSYSGDFNGIIGVVLVPAGAGYGAVPIVDMLAALMPSVNHYLIVGDGSKVYWAVAETISAGKIVAMHWLGGTV